MTDYSVCLCECVLCACVNSVRFATNDVCPHKTGSGHERGFRLCYISVPEANVYWSLHIMGLFKPNAIQKQPCPLPDQQNSSHLLTISRSRRTRHPPHDPGKKKNGYGNILDKWVTHDPPQRRAEPRLCPLMRRARQIKCLE